MAKAKQQPMRTLYHIFFCGEGNLGESDGFFSLESGKLEYVDGWDCNDAHWRGEYMTGLLEWAGVKIEKLPAKYLDEAVKIAEKQWGLSDGGGDESGEPEDIQLAYQESTSDKVYELELYPDVEGDPDTTWLVVAHYGRRGGNLKEEIKGKGLSYTDAKETYEKVLKQKLSKGYKIQ